MGGLIGGGGDDSALEAEQARLRKQQEELDKQKAEMEKKRIAAFRSRRGAAAGSEPERPDTIKLGGTSKLGG